MDGSSYHTEGNPLVNSLSLSFLNQSGEFGVSVCEQGLVAGEPLVGLREQLLRLRLPVCSPP